MCGVYMIRNRVNGMYYIGGTEMEFDVRFARHRSMLRSGKAPRLLQACWDLYGEDVFEFTPLLTLPPADVAAREREAIETLKPDLNIYGVRPAKARGPGNSANPNFYDIAGETLTLKQMTERYKVSEATIRKRLKKGVTGAALVAQPHSGPRKPYERRA